MGGVRMEALRYRFGVFELDLGRRQLFESDVERHLSPKALRLLEILIEERPSAISKETLHDAIWPETFVTESNLAGLAAEIRAALDDDPRQPRFIRTVHGYGYAFCGEATNEGAPEAVAARRKVGRIFRGDREIDLLEGENEIGREGSRANIVIDDPTVSRRHAVISAGQDRVTVVDCGSKNGTFVGGRRIAAQPVELLDGIDLRVGSVELIYRKAGDREPTVTMVTE
jgi:DNA-binding winged helix-turn-helix (wHTH) protein